MISHRGEEKTKQLQEAPAEDCRCNGVGCFNSNGRAQLRVTPTLDVQAIASEWRRSVQNAIYASPNAVFSCSRLPRIWLIAGRVGPNSRLSEVLFCASGSESPLSYLEWRRARKIRKSLTCDIVL